MAKGSLGFLSFLSSLNGSAARNAKEMNDLIFTYPSSAIVKAGILIEEIISDVFKIEEIQEKTNSNLNDKILHLYKQGYIRKGVYDSFTTIRRARNKAAHDSTSNSLVTAITCHEELYNVAKWYFESYGELDKEIPVYEFPKQRQPNISEIVAGQFRDELSKVIEDVAKSQFGKANKVDTPKSNQPKVVEKNKREKQPVKAQRHETLETSKEVNVKIDEKIAEGERKEAEEIPIREESNQASLLKMLTKLRDSSQEAIENADSFSEFKEYLHVNRQIQIDLENTLKSNYKSDYNNLILLCGSVGDGKSHLLAYLKENKPELIGKYQIFNDATESISPTMDAMESLEENLKAFSDQLIGSTSNKIVLAINMGVLHNFINREHKVYTYNKLKQFVDKSQLFTEEITTTFHQGCFNLISFGDYHYYELTETGPESSFYKSLLNKIVNPSKDNPFYVAYIQDLNKQKKTIIHQNYKFLQNENVRQQVIQLIIGAIVQHKLVISARAFLNFVTDIIVPDYYNGENTVYGIDQLRYTLPNLIFNRGERSEILRVIKQSDPIHIRLKEVDDIYIKLNTYENLEQLADEYNLNEISKEILSPFLNELDKNSSSFKLGVKTFIRILLLTHNDFLKELLDKKLTEYLFYVFAFNTKNERYVKDMYGMIKTCVNLWQGHINQEYTFIEKNTSQYKVAQKLNYRPDITHLQKSDELLLKSFIPTIQLIYTDEAKEKFIELDTDFPLFQLLKKVEKGYLPNKSDQEDAVKFVEFVDKLMSIGSKVNEVLIHYTEDKKDYILRRDDFGGYVFEKRL